MSARVIIVHLRRPDVGDKRTDPLYEFGSFGLTGCHRKNLLADGDAAGARLAFAQGGDLGFRLVMLTPAVDVRQLATVREAFWSPGDMPLRYDTAPILIDNDGSSDVEGMRELLADVNRTTWEAKFSSSFRTRKQPLDPALAADLVRAWDSAFDRGAERAEAYWEALPYWEEDVVDRDRHGTHQKWLRRARGEDPSEDGDQDDDTEDATTTGIPAGATCRPRKLKTAAKPGPKKPRRC